MWFQNIFRTFVERESVNKTTVRDMERKVLVLKTEYLLCH